VEFTLFENRGNMADDKKKQKRPSALKRVLQDNKKRLRNKSFRSSVQTAIRSLKSSISQKESTDELQKKLSNIYSLMDKGVKKGVYKSNKAARTKSRLSSHVS